MVVKFSDDLAGLEGRQSRSPFVGVLESGVGVRGALSPDLARARGPISSQLGRGQLVRVGSALALSVVWRQGGEKRADSRGQESPAAGFFDQSIEIEPEDASNVLLVTSIVGCQRSLD